MNRETVSLMDKLATGHRPSHEESLQLIDSVETADLMAIAASLRDQGHGRTISYSKNVFIPLTHLCRDVCHYCTFAHPPKKGEVVFMPIDEIVETAKKGAAAGCKEALFTLGDKPELRYRAAREALAELGHETTISYLAEAAEAVRRETGLLPHLNPGVMTAEDLELLRPVSVSMGIMLETASGRLSEKGMPHYGSPDKEPSARLETIRLAGEKKIPFTSGILIGIGETRVERIESLLELRDLHDDHGHIQEIIIQNFRRKPGTKMENAPEPSLEDYQWTLAMSRIIFGPEMNIQAPPNLSPDDLGVLLDTGISDWGGVSPITPDFVNPEAPWPHLQRLRDDTTERGFDMAERLATYPNYLAKGDEWVDEKLRTNVLHLTDGEGFAREESWAPGDNIDPPQNILDLIENGANAKPSLHIASLIERATAGERLHEDDIADLFRVRGEDFGAVCHAANELRKQVNGDTVSYVVNRNINYTNVCYFKCQFCAFSKGKMSESLRGDPYVLGLEEIQRRSQEAWARGATEICLQGGIHPQYTGQHYIDIVEAVKDVCPDMHIHAFTPLEIWQGAETLGISIHNFLKQLQEAGLDTLPGTAAEILDDEIRDIICEDKINTAQWVEVMNEAHKLNYHTTTTVMYGHVEGPINWARHLLVLRDQQEKTGGFTEFVPLPFVHMESPIYLKGNARKGPTFREAVLMHAVARLVLHGQISNIQGSWVKMGPKGVEACLNAGANDVGGTLMNETITRAAGASHGQEMEPHRMEELIKGLHRNPRQRSTTYGEVTKERVERSFQAAPLEDNSYTHAKDFARKKKLTEPLNPV